MELQVGVKVFLKNKENKYLLLQRSSKYSHIAGMWDIPGGRINHGSELLVNLKREVIEETGLSLQNEPVLLLAQDIFPKDGKKHIVRLTYKGLANGEPKLDDEHAAYGWFDLRELANLENLDLYTKKVIDEGLLA